MSAPQTQLPIASQADLCVLLTWQNPVATGKVFGAILAALILVKINIFSHIFHLGYLALLASAAAEYAGRVLTGQGFVKKYLGNPKSKAHTFRESALPALANAYEVAEAKAHTILYAQDIESTLKAAGASYILYKLTAWFSLYSLVFALVLAAFSVPMLYQSNKKEIDAAVAQYTKVANQKFGEYSACAKKNLGPKLETLAEKTGPVGAFVKSKFPTRTAGSTVGEAAEPSTGVSTGVSTGYSGSQFPEVPSSAPKSIPELVDETKALIDEDKIADPSL